MFSGVDLDLWCKEQGKATTKALPCLVPGGGTVLHHAPASGGGSSQSLCFKGSRWHSPILLLLIERAEKEAASQDPGCVFSKGSSLDPIFFLPSSTVTRENTLL